MNFFSLPENRKCFLVYQMGKVGSTAIAESLSDEFGKSAVKHTHDHVLAEQIIRDRLAKQKEVVIVTGFREPLTRCISAYFQNIDNPQNRYWYVGTREEVLGKSSSWRIADYKKKAPHHVAEVVSPWLSRFQKVTGLSPQDFERSGNLWTASTGKMTCFLYKLESMTDFFRDTGVDSTIAGLSLKSTNVGREKWYQDLYRDFTSRFQISSADYQSVYRSIDYVDCLYDDEELQRYTSRYLVDEPLTDMAAPE